MVKILTQENCPNCKTLEKYIEGNGEIRDKVEFIKREDNEDLFMKMVTDYNIMATPSAIVEETNKVLPSANPASFKVFLKMNKLF